MTAHFKISLVHSPRVAHHALVGLPVFLKLWDVAYDPPWKPGYLRSAYGAICCHRFKPQNMTDDIFLAQILGHKLLGPNAALSVGQSYKDFYIRTP